MWAITLLIKPDQLHNNKKKDKGIYGNASPEDIKELSRGIETRVVP